MQAGGTEPEDNIAGGDIRPRQQPSALGGADRKAGEVIVPAGIKAWHFGGFAADQRGVALPAALRDAGDDLGADLGIEMAGRIISRKTAVRRLGR